MARATFPSIGEVSLQPGDRLWIRGANGTGKTSLLRCLAGLDAPMGATGERGATLCFQDARDNLIGLTVDGERRLRQLPIIGDRRESSKLSTGETTRLGLQLTNSEVWLLDEPAEALDTAGVAWLREKIASHEGAIAFVDHTEKLADLATKTIDLGSLHADTPSIQNQARPPLKIGNFTSTTALTILQGPNGCGKSTLLREFAKANDCAYLPPRAKDLLLEPFESDWLSPPDRHPLQWSGGERQRMALAHTFAKKMELYVLDEPEKHLDSAGIELLVIALQTIIDRGGRIITASHHLEGELVCF